MRDFFILLGTSRLELCFKDAQVSSRAAEILVQELQHRFRQLRL
jgi:hypothetical protein